MRTVLGERTLFTGAIGSFASLIARSVLAATAEENGAVVAYVVDDASGISIVQSYGQLEKIRDKHNPKLSIEVVHPALTVADQIVRLKKVQDTRPLVCVFDYSRQLQAFSNDHPVLHWQKVIARALGCKTLVCVHNGHLPIKPQLDWRPFSDVWKLADGFVQGSPPRARINEPWDLVQAKGGNRTVHLIGKPEIGTIVFSEIKPELANAK